MTRDKQERADTSHGDEQGHHETALIRKELELVREQLNQHQTLSSREIDQATATIEDLRKRLDNAENEKSSLTVLLEHHTKQDAEAAKPKGLFGKLFG